MKRSVGDASQQSGVQQGLTPAARQGLVKELQKKLFDQLGTGIKDTLQETENALFDAMDQARSNEVRSRYMENIAALRPARQQIIDGFLLVHLDAFKEYFSGRAASRSLDGEETGDEKSGLALLNKDEHEESLLVTTMSGRLNRDYGLELVVMRRRLAYLADADYDDDTLSPLCPETVASSLQQGLLDKDISLSLKSVLYMEFERHVMAALQKTYRELEGFFSERKILPDLNVELILAEMSAAQREKQLQADTTRKSRQEETGLPQTPEQPAGGEAEQPAGQAVAQGESGSAFQQQIEQQISEINQLLGSYRNTLGVVLPSGSRMLDSFAPAGARKTYSDSQILQALKAMQQDRASRPVTEKQDTDSFKQGMYQTLAASTANAKDFRIGGHESNLVDLVGMLFDFVKEEDTLPEGSKDVLFNLQNLYCQVALRDAEFFHNTTHPAHELLNRMIQAGSQFYSGNEGRLLAAAIEETVQRALREYRDDDGVFDDLLGRFDKQVDTLRQRVDKRERRAVEAAKGREKLLFARRHARGFIDVCVKRYSPPEIIREFLQGAWADVLVFIFLRQGPSSRQWQDRARVAEQLAWSCTPLDEAQRQEFAAQKEPLMAAIQQSLELLGCYSEIEIQRVIQDIQICQQAVQTQQHEVVQSLNTALPSSIAQVDEAELALTEELNESQMSKEELELVETLRQVRFGTWFDFKDPPQRLKLAWFSPTTQRYMFVDSDGQGSFVKNRGELFELLLKNGASIVEKTAPAPFFERAMQAIQRTLRQFTGSYVDEIRKSKPTTPKPAGT